MEKVAENSEFILCGFLQFVFNSQHKKNQIPGEMEEKAKLLLDPWVAE